MPSVIATITLAVLVLMGTAGNPASAVARSASPSQVSRSTVVSVRLHGVVEVRHGDPTQIEVTLTDSTGSILGRVMAGDDKRFDLRLEAVAPGRYQLQAFAPGEAFGVPLDVLVTRPLDQRVTLVLAGGAVRRAAGARSRPPTPPVSPPATTDPGGTAAFVEEGEDFNVVKVFYATDRRVTGRKEPDRFYGKQRGQLALGTCTVSIPIGHKKGELEKPSFWWPRENPERHVVLLTLTPTAMHSFYSELGAGVAACQSHQAFVFVHGFNTSFEDAVRRTAQIAYDLQIDIAPICYSWPAVGNYPADATTVEATIANLETFLSEVAARTGASRVHLIAHSMGNRALMRALQQIAIRTQPQDSLRFNQIILTAPDLDVDVFCDLAVEVQRAAQHVTLYASSNDKALKLSQKFNVSSRAGLSGKNIVVLPGMDTVDVSALETDFIGHGYFAENRSVIADIREIFLTNRPPNTRFGIRRTAGGFWVFQP